MSTSTGALDRRGVWIAVAAYVAWGLMPLYWHLLKVVPSMQIMAHRVVWSALLVCGWLGIKYGHGWLRETLSRPRATALLAFSGVLIAFNWGLYIWAVNAGHVVESALGYFINPLFSVMLGVLVLHERLNRVQWLSVAIAAIGVLWLTLNYGGFPWIALALAASFGLYGLVRKLLGAPPVLLVNHALRPLLSRFLRRSLNQLVVLSNMELSDNRHIRMTATIGGK